METENFKNSLKGPILILASAVLFSFAGTFIKFIPWSSMALNGARNFTALIVLLFYLKIIGHKIIFSRDVIIGAIAYSATTTLFVFANKMTTAANAIVLQFTMPIFVIFFSWLLFRSKPDKTDVITCAAVFAGIIFFFMDGLKSGGMLGNILATVSGITYAVVFMMNTFPKSDTLSSLLFGQILCAVTGLPFIAFETVFTPITLITVLIMGVLPVGTAYICLMQGLKCTPPLTASLISAIEPVLNPIWVALFCHETITPAAFAGFIIVFTAIIAYNIIKGKKK